MCVVAAAPAAGAAASSMTAMQTVSILATIGSTLMTGYGMYQQGQNRKAEAEANAKIAEANAKVSEKKARNAEYQGVLERQRIGLEEAEVIGEGRTKYAAGNVELGSGSPVDWEVDTTERANADKRMSKYNAKVNAWGERTNASSSQYQAQLYRSSGSNYAKSGLIGGGTSLLAGAATVSDKYYRYTYK